MLRECLAALLLISPLAAFAQDSGEGAQLHWQTQLTPVDGAPGVVDITFESAIAPGWIVYASDFTPPEIGPIPARLKLDPAAQADGALQSPQTHVGEGENFAGKYTYTYFKDKAQFRQSISVPAGTIEVSGTLRGQACQEETGLCTLFRESFRVAL